jgi:hypothetical protein
LESYRYFSLLFAVCVLVICHLLRAGYLLIWFLGIFLFNVRGFLQIFVLNVSRISTTGRLSVSTAAASTVVLQQRTRSFGQVNKGASKDIDKRDSSKEISQERDGSNQSPEKDGPKYEDETFNKPEIAQCHKQSTVTNDETTNKQIGLEPSPTSDKA